MKLSQLEKIAAFLRKKNNTQEKFSLEGMAETIKNTELKSSEYDVTEKLMAYISGAATKLVYCGEGLVDNFGYYCTFTEAYFPNATSITGSAFKSNPFIDTVIFDTLLEISSTNAFENSTIKALIIKTPQLCNLKSSFFAGVLKRLKKLKVYVPDDLVTEYKSATNWTTISDNIYPLSDYYVEEA